MSFELKLAVQGRLTEHLKAEVDAFEQAAMGGMHKTIDAGKIFARGQVAAAGFGQRLANTWRSQIYPQRGASANAAGLLFTRAPVIVDAFDRGVTIMSSQGLYLAIPTQFAPKNVSFIDPVSGGMKRNKRVTPRGIEQALGVKLRFVFNPRGTSFLVADNLRLSKKKGTARLAGKRAIAKGDVKTLPLFWLVKTVTLPKKLDLAAIEKKMETELEPNVMAEWQRIAPNA